MSKNTKNRNVFYQIYSMLFLSSYDVSDENINKNNEKSTYSSDNFENTVSGIDTSSSPSSFDGGGGGMGSF